MLQAPNKRDRACMGAAPKLWNSGSPTTCAMRTILTNVIIIITVAVTVTIISISISISISIGIIIIIIIIMMMMMLILEDWNFHATNTVSKTF